VVVEATAVAPSPYPVVPVKYRVIVAPDMGFAPPYKTPAVAPVVDAVAGSPERAIAGAPAPQPVVNKSPKVSIDSDASRADHDADTFFSTIETIRRRTSVELSCNPKPEALISARRDPAMPAGTALRGTLEVPRWPGSSSAAKPVCPIQ
jgi:hypothetical protein